MRLRPAEGSGGQGGGEGEFDAGDQSVAPHREIDARDVVALHRDGAGLRPADVRSRAGPKTETGDEEREGREAQAPGRTVGGFHAADSNTAAAVWIMRRTACRYAHPA